MMHSLPSSASQPSPNNPEIALAGTLVILLFGTAFDKTAPWAIGILLFMLGAVWITAYQNGSLGQALQIMHFTGGG